MRILPLILLIACGCGEKEEQPEARPAGDAAGGNTRATEPAPEPSRPRGETVSKKREPAWTDAETDRTTDSGLKYKVLKEGDGTQPALGDRVRVHYTGWLTNGVKFDSSRDRREPTEFVLGQVIEGWNEGVPLMKTGARYKFLIPWKLAYGARGRPPRIPARADLVFDVELLAVTVLPKHRPLHAAETTTTASGLKYEMVKPGEGDAPGADDIVRLRYFVWSPDGKLLASSDAGARPRSGRCSELKLTPGGEKFLQEATQLLRLGGQARFEVPPELCWGNQTIHPEFMPGNSTSFWFLELQSVTLPPPMPTFRQLDATRAQQTKSGLKYEVIREGTGKRPTATDRVNVYYTGWLTDGTEFDSAHRRGEPIGFGLSQVIRGWTEGLQLMQEGGIYLFEIPAELGYGARGSGRIPPNATLIFLVELLAVE